MRENPNDPEKIVILSLGSNLGRREETILQAIHRLETTPNLIIEAVSSLYETSPLGISTDKLFINAVCEGRTALPPRDLLAICLALEKDFGRVRSYRTMDRTLDIDIAVFGDLLVRESDLVLPHPRLRERLFVLVPLAEIHPGFCIPPDGATVESVLASSNCKGNCMRISSRGEIG